MANALGNANGQSTPVLATRAVEELLCSRLGERFHKAIGVRAFTGMRVKWRTLVLVLASACSDERAKDPDLGRPSGGAGALDSGISGGGANAGASGAGSGGSTAGNAYRVSIRARKTRVCSGECVELTAQAEHGHEPYEYAWSGGLEAGAGPHEVCPDATTRYEVVAKDTGIEGEFGRESQEASAVLEIRVDEDCVARDGGAVDDGGVIDEAPDTTVLCSVRIPHGDPNWLSSYTGWEASSNLETDAEGNLYVAGALQGTVDVGGESLTSVGTHDGVLLKYDPSCKLLWAKAYGTSGAQIGLSSVAVGRSGEVVIGGSLTGAADLGRGPLASGIGGSALLMKVDPQDGSVIWNEVYGSLFTNAVIWDVGIDDAGEIYISGYASGDASFGGPPIGGPADGNVAFIAKLGSDAQHRFSFSMLDANLLAPFALHPSGSFVLTGWTQASEVSIGSFNLDLGTAAWKRYVALLNEHGELLWGRAIAEDEGAGEGEFLSLWGGGIAIDNRRNVVLEHGLYRATDSGAVEEWPERISKLGEDGVLLWTEEFVHEDHDNVYVGEGGLIVDGSDNIVHSDERSWLRSADADAGADAHNRMYVQKLDPDGDVIWRHWFEGARLQWSWGLASGQDDAVWVLLGEEGRAGMASNDSAIVIAKLAP